MYNTTNEIENKNEATLKVMENHHFMPKPLKYTRKEDY